MAKSITASARVAVRHILVGVSVLGIVAAVLLVGLWLFVWFHGDAEAGPTHLPAPAYLWVRSSDKGTYLHWTPLAGAVSYQVSVSPVSDGPYHLAGSAFGDSPLAHHFPVFFERALRVLLHVPLTSFGRVPENHFLDTAEWTSSPRYYRVRGFVGDAWTSWSQPRATSQREKVESETTIVTDLGAHRSAFIHKWDTVGMEHLGYLLRDDGVSPNHGGATLLAALGQERQELGFEYVIAHGVFLSDLGVLKTQGRGVNSYDWSKLDSVYDKLVARNLKPVVQLSFMPPELAADPKAGTIWSYHANSSPPRSYDDWSALVYALAKHLESRYGATRVREWPFDVWNEPDLCVPAIVCYWKGSAADYYRLYDVSVEALRSVDPLLQVGGPVSVYPDFVNGFLAHVSTHRYSFGTTASALDFLDVRVYDAPADNWRPLLDRYGLHSTKIWYTEWGIHNINQTHITDSAYAAPWIVSNLVRSLPLVDHIGFWNASDDFIEKGPPQGMLSGGYGLIGLYDVPKPSFRAFQMLNQMGGTLLATRVEGDEGSTTISAIATCDGSGKVQLLIANVTNDQWFAEGALRLNSRVRIRMEGLAKRTTYSLSSQIVDRAHASIYDSWLSAKSPKWPTTAQLQKLRISSGMAPVGLPSVTTDDQGTAVLSIDAPMPSLRMLTIEKQ